MHLIICEKCMKINFVIYDTNNVSNIPGIDDIHIHGYVLLCQSCGNGKPIDIVVYDNF